MTSDEAPLPSQAAADHAAALDGDARCTSVFRERWRDRQSGATRPGELVSQPGWIGAGLVALGVMLTAGAVTAGTVTTERATTLPAVADGMSVTGIRSGEAPPARGTAAQFRDSSGTTWDAVVVEVTANEVKASMRQRSSGSAGALVYPAGREPLITVLLPRLR